MNKLTIRSFFIAVLFALALPLHAQGTSSDFQSGVTAYKDKDYVSALAFFQKALQANPTNAQVLNAIGNCYVLQGNYSEAIKAYDQALALNPANTQLKAYNDDLKQRFGPHPDVVHNDTNYVWDPAVDFYPKVTGAPSPIAFTARPAEDISITGLYRTGFFMSLFSSSILTSTEDSVFNSNEFAFRVRYKLLPNLLIGVGYDLWDIPLQGSINPYIASTYLGYSTSYGYGRNTYLTDKDMIVSSPVIGVYTQTNGKDINFIAGIETMVNFFNLDMASNYGYYDLNNQPQTFVYSSTYNAIDIQWALDMDLQVQLLTGLRLDIDVAARVGGDAQFYSYGNKQTEVGKYSTVTFYPANVIDIIFASATGGIGLTGNF